MKLQPQLLVNTADVFRTRDRADAVDRQLQYCISETKAVPEPLQHVSGPSCLPWLVKPESHAGRSYHSCDARQSTRFALCCKDGVLQQSCCVVQHHEAAYTSHSASWRSNCAGPATWLSRAGCWSATAESGSSSLILRNLHTATEQHIPGPGLGDNSWQQVFVQDEGAALLALAQRSERHQQQGSATVMHLWRQLGNSSDQHHKSWSQLPALPALAQSSSAESCVQAVFAQQGFRGLQLRVAHAVPVDAGVLLMSVLQQPVCDPCSVAQRNAASSSWNSMLINLPGAEPAYSLMLQQQHTHGMCSVQLHAVAVAPVSASPCRSPNKTAAAALGSAAADGGRLSVLLSWHPAGTQLAAALSTDAAAWIVLLGEGVEHMQDCWWSNLVDTRATGLLHAGPCHICSLAWVSGLSDTLAAIDTHGRLCILAGGALEPLQLMDMAGMTVTFKPTLQLHFNNLLAATGSQSSVVTGLNQNFLLAALPATESESTSSSSSSSTKLTGSQQRLAIWNGNHLLVSALYHGIDPSQRRIDQSVNARALMLYGRASAQQLTPQKQQQEQLDVEEHNNRLLTVLLTEPVGPRGSTDAAMGGTMLVQGPRAFAARGAASSGCVPGHPLAAVAVVRNALLQGGSQLSLLGSSNLAACNWRGTPSQPASVNPAYEDDNFWLQLAEGDEAFLAGRWQDCEDAYKEALPLSAGHLVSLLMCRYRIHEALALIQRLLVDVFEAREVWHNTPGQQQLGPGAGPKASATAAETSTADTSEQEGCTPDTAAASDLQQEQRHILRLALQLTGTLTGLTADVLLAAVRENGGVATAVPAAPKLPCIFPTPLHWTKWLRGSAERQVKWELTAGMAVELLPGTVLSALAQQLSLTSLQDSSCSTSLHALRDAAARATGLLLLSEVLAAEAEGVLLPDDLPELLTHAVAKTALPTAPGCCSSSGDDSGRPGVLLWQQAAVLARSCSNVIRELQTNPHLADAFDVAARSVLWQHLLSHQSQQLPQLSQRAVAVVAVAASLWPVDHPCLQLLTNKVLGLLCRCLTLRVLSLPVLPAARLAIEQPLQQSLVLLLLQALPEAVAAAARAVDPMQHSAQAALQDRNVQQLLQLLASLQLKLKYSDNLVDGAHLASALAAAGAACTPDGCTPLTKAGLAVSDSGCNQQQHLELQPSQLTEWSGACDIQIVTSAILLAVQAAAGSAPEVASTVQQSFIELAAAAPNAGKSRMRLPVQHTAADGSNQSWLQQEKEAGTSIKDALHLIVKVAWLMHCRQQLADLAVHSNPEMLAGLAIALAAADGVHKAALVQQAVVSVLVGAGCSVTQHHVQQLQSVLDGCCGGALPRTADQLRKLKLGNCGQLDNGVAWHWELQCKFLEQLQAAAAAAAGGVAGSANHCGYLPAALHPVHRHGVTCIQTHRQAVPGLQACLVHPLAGTPEASATTAKLALAAVFLGSSCLTTHSQQPSAGQAGMQADADLLVDAVQLDVDEADTSAERMQLAEVRAGAAAVQLHAAAAAWQRQHVSALQDESLMRDVRAALCSSSRWSVGSFLAGGSSFRPGLLSARSGLLSARSRKSLNPAEFEDYLLPNGSFVAPAATSASPRAAAAVSQSAAASSGKLAGQHSTGQHKWDNPLAAPSDLDSFFAVYSPLGSSRAASPTSPDNVCTAAANPSTACLRQQQAQRPLQLLTSPGSLQQSQLPPHKQPCGNSLALERLESLRNSAPSSTHASPHSSAGQFSPLHQQLLLHQPSTAASVPRARSLSRSQSSEVWGIGLGTQQRKSSIGAAMDAISPQPTLLDASLCGGSSSTPEQQRVIRRSINTNSATAAPAAAALPASYEVSKFNCSEANQEWGSRTAWASLTGVVSAAGMPNERATCSPVIEQPLQEQHSTASEDGHVVVQLTIRSDKLPDSACIAANAHEQSTACSVATSNPAALQQQQQRQQLKARNKPPMLNVAQLSSPAASRKLLAGVGRRSPMDSTEMNSPNSNRRVAPPVSNTAPQTLSPGSPYERHGGLRTTASAARSTRTTPDSAVRRATPAAADSSGRPIGEAIEHFIRIRLACDMTDSAATIPHSCQRKQPRTSKKWLQKLKQACRWPGSSKYCCQVEVLLQTSSASSIGSARQPGPLAEGVESDTGTTCSSSVGSISSAGPGRASGAAAGANLATPAPNMSAAAAASTSGALYLLPDAAWGPSSGFGSMLGSTSSSPHTLNADAQQRLDEIFKAHLPQFLDILSQGLSPVKEPSCMGGHGPGKHRDNSPTIQRSFSATELSRAQLSDGGRPRDNLMLLSAENAASLWTQAPGISEPYSSSRCSSSSVTVDQPQGVVSAQQQCEAQTAAPAGNSQQRCPLSLEAGASEPTAALSWQAAVTEGLPSHRANLQVSSTAAVHIPSAAPGNRRSNTGPLLPMQCQPLGMGAAGLVLSTVPKPYAVPVAEGTENSDEPCTSKSNGSSAYAPYDAYAPPRPVPSAAPTAVGSMASQQMRHSSVGRSADFDNIQQMMQLAHMMLMSSPVSGGAALEKSHGTDRRTSRGQQPNSTAPGVTAAAAAAAAQGVGGFSTWEDPEAAVTEDYSDNLDLTDFMGCFSPAAGSRQLSRVASRNAAAAAAAHSPGGIFARNSATAGNSLQDSPHVSSSNSLPDMTAFWADPYSRDPSRAVSRQISGHDYSPQCNNPSYLNAQRRQQQLQDQSGKASDDGVIQHVGVGNAVLGSKVQYTPSPSRKSSMLLHRPSRLSWKSPAGAADMMPAGSAAEAPAASIDAAVKAAVAAAIASVLRNDIHAPTVDAEASGSAQRDAAHAAEATYREAAQVTVQEEEEEQQQQQQPSLDEAAALQPRQSQQQLGTHEQQQQQTAKHSDKPLLKRMLFGRKGLNHTERNQELQQVVLQEYKPLQNAVAKLPIQQAQQDAEQLPVPKKHGGFFSFLRSSSGSGSKSKQPQVSVSGVASCPVTPVAATADAAAVGSSPFSFRGEAGVGQTLPPPEQQQSASQHTTPLLASRCAVSPTAGAAVMLPTIPSLTAAGPAGEAASEPAAKAGGLATQQQITTIRERQQLLLGAMQPAQAAQQGAASHKPSLKEKARLPIGAQAAEAPNPTLSVATGQSSPAVDILASSMQRIAGFLEEFLADCSPAKGRQAANNPTPGTAAIGAEAAEAAIPCSAQPPAATYGSPVRAPGEPTPHFIGRVQGCWSPAAAAAKARIMRSSANVLYGSEPFAPVHTHTTQQQMQQLHAPLPVAASVAASQVEAAAAPAVVAQEGTAAAAIGSHWLHPSSLRPNSPATVAQAAAAALECAMSARQEAPVYSQQARVDVSPANAGVPAAAVNCEDAITLQALAARATGTALLRSNSPVAADYWPKQLQAEMPQSVCFLATGQLPAMASVAHEQHETARPSRQQQTQVRAPGLATTEDCEHVVTASRQGSPARYSPVMQHQCQALHKPSSPSHLAVLQRVHAPFSAAAATAATATGTPSVWQRQQQETAVYRSNSSASDSEDDWQEMQFREQYSFLVQPDAAAGGPQQAILQHALSPAGMGGRYCAIQTQQLEHINVTAASARCFLAAAEVKLLQPEKVTHVRLLRPSQLGPEQPAPQEVQQHTNTTAQESARSHSRRKREAVQGCHATANLGFDSYRRSRQSEPRLVPFPVQRTAQTLQPPALPKTLHQHDGQKAEQQPVQQQQQQQQQATCTTQTAQQQLWAGGLQRRPVAPWSSGSQIDAYEAAPANRDSNQPVVIDMPQSAAAGSASTGQLTAGRRAAQLLQSLNQQQPKESRAGDMQQAGAMQQQQQQLAPWQQQAKYGAGVTVELCNNHDGVGCDESSVPWQVSSCQASVAMAAAATSAAAAPSSAATAVDSRPILGAGCLAGESASRQRQKQQPQFPMRKHKLHSRHPATSGSTSRSPVRSPRKATSVNTKWMLLQQLKARNRANRCSKAERDPAQTAVAAEPPQDIPAADGLGAAHNLITQLQGLMQGPVAASTDSAQAQQQVDASFTSNLDAAAASALQGVLEQALLVRQSRSLSPQQQPTAAAVNQTLLPHQTVGTLSTGNAGLADSISFGDIGTQPEQQQQLAGGDSNMQMQEPAVLASPQPLLLPRMLSRAPLLDAEVQVGGMRSLLQQTSMAATQTALAEDPEPVKVVLQVEEGQPASIAQQQQQQQAPMSPAALVALAAAAGAGAASAVRAAAPAGVFPRDAAASFQTAAPQAALMAPDQQRDAPKHKGVLELAQLILTAFESSGGVIRPSIGDDTALVTDNRAGGAVAQVAMGTGSNSGLSVLHELLPNPLAGPTAPQFLQVMDFIPEGLNVQNKPAGLCHNAMSQHQQWQHQEAYVQQRSLSGQHAGTSAQGLHLGCCFAACPERMPSPTFKGSPGGASHQGLDSNAVARQGRQGQHKDQGSAKQAACSNKSRQSSSSMHTASATDGLHKLCKAHKPTSTKQRAGRRSSHGHHCRHERNTADAEAAQKQQQPQGGQSQRPTGSGTQDGVSAVAGSDAPLTEWRAAQTQQLDQLWQQWQRQQLQAQQRQQEQHQTQSPHAPAPSKQPLAHQQLLQQQQQENMDLSMPLRSEVASRADTSEQQQGVEMSGWGSCSAAGAPPAAPQDKQSSDGYSKLAGMDTSAAVLGSCDGGRSSTLASAAARAAAKKLADAEQQLSQQQFAQQCLGEERASLDAAYARANAARAVAKAAAEKAAAARRDRMRAELEDLSRMLQEVDDLAAQMETEAAEAAAVVDKCSWQEYRVASNGEMTATPLDTRTTVGTVRHVGSFKHKTDDGLLHLREAVLEAAALGDEADALSRSLKGLGGKLSTAVAM